MYDAINRGLRRATGEILAHLNSDEQYFPETLSVVSGFFALNPNVEVLFGDALLVDDRGAPLSYRRMVLPRSAHVRLVHLNTLTCATFFRRSLVERGHLFDLRWKVVGDAAWVDGLLRAGVKMATLQEPLAAFTFTGANLGASARGKEEAAQLRGGTWKSALVPFLSLQHRFRKWSAGAYAPQAVDYGLYTIDSPNQRRRFTARKVGFGWPHHLATQAPS